MLHLFINMFFLRKSHYESAFTFYISQTIMVINIVSGFTRTYFIYKHSEGFIPGVPFKENLDLYNEIKRCDIREFIYI